MITIDFKKINEEDCSTEHLIFWKIENPERTVFPRKDELIMLPEILQMIQKHVDMKSGIS